MKRILIIIASFIIVFPQQEIQAEVSEEEIKEVIEEFVNVKDIEWEIVFGLPIEDVRLMDNLVEGRNIQYVIEHFEKYYEDDVLEQYLYYLKRSTEQEFYYREGMFWGVRFGVPGNIYKREATNVEYEIDYQSIEYHSDIVEVATLVTKVYYGDYLVRGVESSEYKEDPKELVFHLRESEDGEWKLVQLSDEVMKEIESEIKESIDLNQKEEIQIYDEVKTLNGIEKYNVEDINLIYDALLRLTAGGKDALYDQYKKVWLGGGFIYPSYTLDEINLFKNFELSNLKEDYKGWDYAYIFSNDKVYTDIFVFNIEDEDIVRMSIIPFFEEEELEKVRRAQKIIDPFVDALNQKTNILLGEVGGHENSRKDLEEFLGRYYNDGLYGNERWIHFYGEPFNTLGETIVREFVDDPRFIENVQIYSKVINEVNGDFSRMNPPGKQMIKPYDNYEIIKVYENLQGEIRTYRVEVIAHYFYEEINLFYYGSEEINLIQSDAVGGGQWFLTVFTP